MILTVAQLKQPILADAPIATGRRAIQTHPLRVQLVHTDDALVERRLKALPLLRLGQRIEHQCQPIIAPPALLHLLSRTQLQRLPPRGHPALHLIHPMISFRHDMGQPDRCRPAQAHSLPVAMRLEVGIQQLRQTHLVTVGQQEWNIVHSFCYYTHLFCHADSLPHFPNLVTI